MFGLTPIQILIVVVIGFLVFGVGGSKKLFRRGANRVKGPNGFGDNTAWARSRLKKVPGWLSLPCNSAAREESAGLGSPRKPSERVSWARVP